MRHIKRRRKATTATKMAELAIAAPQVIATRTASMLAAGAHPDAAQRAEFSRMYSEKVQVFWESIFAMGAQAARTNQENVRRAAVQWWRLWTTPWWLTVMRPTMNVVASGAHARAASMSGLSRNQQKRAMSKLVRAGLGPIHKRATANARRLARTRKAAS
jgi:hypothetical protein